MEVGSKRWSRCHSHWPVLTAQHVQESVEKTTYADMLGIEPRRRRSSLRRSTLFKIGRSLSK